MPALCYWYVSEFRLKRTHSWKSVLTNLSWYLLQTPINQRLTVNLGLFLSLHSTDASFYWLKPPTTTTVSCCDCYLVLPLYFFPWCVLFVCACAVSQTFCFKPPGGLHSLPCMSEEPTQSPSLSRAEWYGGSSILQQNLEDREGKLARVMLSFGL